MVVSKRGRKLEEGDWTEVYCAAVGVEDTGWSNLEIDVIGKINDVPRAIEMKMLGLGDDPVVDALGSWKMHPAATRRVTLNTAISPEDAMQAVLDDYSDVLASHRKRASETLGVDESLVELKSGWLLWRQDLSEFAYWEEELKVPEIGSLRAEWRERQGTSGGRRRVTKNLWIYDVETDRKIYSVTDPAAGTKIQPYFKVPDSLDELHHFQTRTVEDGSVTVWLDLPTEASLQSVLSERLKIGESEADAIARLAAEYAASAPSDSEQNSGSLVASVVLPVDAYAAVSDRSGGADDNSAIKLFVEWLLARGS